MHTLISALIAAAISYLLTSLLLGTHVDVQATQTSIEWRPLWPVIAAIVVFIGHILISRVLPAVHEFLQSLSHCTWRELFSNKRFLGIKAAYAIVFLGCLYIGKGWLLLIFGVLLVPFLLFLGAFWSQRIKRLARWQQRTLPAFHRQNKTLLYVGLAIVALVWPFFASRFQLDLSILVLIYIMLALGLNIVVGYAGLLDLGYVAFYAVGAYGYALMSQYWGLSFWQALPLCGLLAALFGFLLGFPVLRLRGDYLAIVTLGFGEIIRLVLNNWDSFTGGPDGIGSIPKPSFFGLEFSRRASEGSQTFHDYFGIAYDSSHKFVFMYLIALLLVFLTLLVINRLIRMPVGRAWEALREDEIACRSLGLNPTTIKLSAFTLGASTAGFAGCFFAARQGFINPESFVFMESVIILAIVVLGGMGSQIGVIVAAILFTVLPEVTRDFEQFRWIIFGVLIVAMMIWRPQGLIPAKRVDIEMNE